MLSSLMRLVEPLVFPLGLIWLAMLVSCIKCLIHKKKKQAILPGAIVLLMTIVGGTPLPFHLLARLERPYVRGPLETFPEADAVIMLGGVLQPSRYDSFEANFGSTTDRILTAGELIRLKKAPLLILGGAELRFEGRVVAEGRLVSGFLQKWGLIGTNLICLEGCKTTRDEAVEVQKLMGKQSLRRIFLVTSAFHMKRATAIFARLEIPVTPIASDFTGLPQTQGKPKVGIIPELDGFKALYLYTHELFGWWYYKLRGWV